MPISYKKYLKIKNAGFTDAEIQSVTGESIPTIFSRQPQLEQESDILNKKAKEFLPTDPTGRPFQYAAAETLKQGIVLPAMDYTNQLAFNIPRWGMAKSGMEYPEAESMPGQFLQKTGGILGAFQNPLTALTGLRGVQKYRQATKALEPILSKIPAGIKKYGTSALAGFGYGAAYTPTEQQEFGDLKERAVRGSMGAITAPLLAGGVALTAQAVKNARKLGTRLFKKTYERALPAVDITKQPESRIARAKAETEANILPIKAQQTILQRKMQSDIIPMEDELTKLQRQKGLVKEETEQKLMPFQKAKIRLGEVKKIKEQELTSQIRQRQEELTKDLYNVAESTALNSKQRIKDFAQKHSDLWRDTLSNISDDLESRGKNLTSDDLISWIDEVQGKLKNSGNVEGMAKLDSLKKELEGLVEGQPLDFTWIKNRLGLIKKGISKQAFTKNKFEQTDLAELGLYDKFSNWAKDVSPEYKNLLKTSQDAYDVINNLSSLAKPGQPAPTKEMRNFLIDYAENNIKKQTQTAYERIGKLESETGQFTQDLKRAQSQLSQFGKTSEDQISNLQKRYNTAAVNLQKRIDAFAELGRKSQDDISNKVNSINDKVRNIKRLSDTEQNKLSDDINNLEDSLRTHIERIKNYPKTGEKNIAKYRDMVKAWRIIKTLAGLIGVSAGSKWFLPRVTGRIIRAE